LLNANDDNLYKLYIEPSSRCNLECTMCFRNTWIDEEFADMKRSVLEKILDSIPDSVNTIFFGGMGEPLIHEDIISMVSHASSLGKRIELLTNGMLLTSEMSSALLDAGLCKLWMSLDSVNDSSYASIRQHSSLPQVLQNITDFNTERARYGNIELGLAFVAMKSNISQLGNISFFAQQYGFCDINVSNMLPTDFDSVEESLASRIVNLGLGTQGAAPKISLPPMDMKIEGVSSSLEALRPLRYCKFIAEGMSFVRHDGEVSPCMALLHSGHTFLEKKKRIVHRHSFGNVGSMGLDEIWNSGEYTAFRKRVREFDFSPCTQCGGCDYRDENLSDCFGNSKPTCGACLWSEGVLSCP